MDMEQALVPMEHARRALAHIVTIASMAHPEVGFADLFRLETELALVLRALERTRSVVSGAAAKARQAEGMGGQ